MTTRGASTNAAAFPSEQAHANHRKQPKSAVMKRVLRGVSLLTVGVYLGLLSLEAFHGVVVKHHVDTQCAVCQLAHETPVLKPSEPLLPAPQRVSLAVVRVVVHPSEAPSPQPHGRSPPLL